MKQWFRILFHCLFEKKRGNSCNSISTRNTKHSFAYWNSFPPPRQTLVSGKNYLSIFPTPSNSKPFSTISSCSKLNVQPCLQSRTNTQTHYIPERERERERALSCALSSYRLGSWLIKIVPSRARSVVC